MKTLTENYNGKVLAIANQGFSIKNATLRIENAIKKIGYSTEKEIAKTGTTYITVYDENDLSVTTVRVSNHTKRGQEEVKTFNFTKDRYGVKCFESIDVLTTYMLNEFLSNVNLLTKYN